MSSVSSLRGRTTNGLPSLALLDKKGRTSSSVSPLAHTSTQSNNSNDRSQRQNRATNDGAVDTQALQLEWVFGLSKDYKSVIHNLSTVQTVSGVTQSLCASSTFPSKRASVVSMSSISHSTLSRQQQQQQQQQSVYQRRVFYTVGHVGIVYDAIQNTQCHLLGHVYNIIASSCSENKRFIVTVDEGDRRLWSRRDAGEQLSPHGGEFLPSEHKDDDEDGDGGDALQTSEGDEAAVREGSEGAVRRTAAAEARNAYREDEDDGSAMIVWDTQSCLPVRRISIGGYGGARCCAMSSDGMYIATINRRHPQEVMLWGWTAAEAASDNEEEEEEEKQLNKHNTVMSDSHPCQDRRRAGTHRRDGTRGGGKHTVQAFSKSSQLIHGCLLGPELMCRIPSQDSQTSLRFSSDDVRLLCSNGARRVFFWSWAEGVLKYYSPPLIRVGGMGHGRATQSNEAHEPSRSLSATPHNPRKAASMGHFTQTMYVPGTELACTGTVDGDVVLWQAQPRDRVSKTQDRTLLKVVRVHNGAVNCVSAESGYIVTGGMDGHVRFFDVQLRLVAWFEELRGGPIVSVSFDKPPHNANANAAGASFSPGEERRAERHLQLSSTSAAAQFTAQDFMVSTAHAMIIHVPAKSFHAGHAAPVPLATTQRNESGGSTTNDAAYASDHASKLHAIRTSGVRRKAAAAAALHARGLKSKTSRNAHDGVVLDPEDGAHRPVRRGRLIVQGQDHSIQCVAAHPSLTRVAIAGLSGNLHIWDYVQRRVLMLSLFRNLPIQCVAYDPSGTTLAVGFTTGLVKILDADSLEARQQFKPKRVDAITRMTFSEDGRMMATGSESGVVGLYERKSHTPSQFMSSVSSNTVDAAMNGGGGGSRANSNRDGAKVELPSSAASETVRWEFIGHHKTHRAAICGLQFAHNTQGELIRLLSVGHDKRLIEYNLMDSSPEAGLLVRMAHKITLGAAPTGFVWTQDESVLDERSRPREGYAEIEMAEFYHENDEEHIHDSINNKNNTMYHNTDADGQEAEADSSANEGNNNAPWTSSTAAAAAAAASIAPLTRRALLDYLLITTDAFKLGVYLSDYDRQCVKTVLAPTFGGPPTGIAVIPSRTHRATQQQRSESTRRSHTARMASSAGIEGDAQRASGTQTRPSSTRRQLDRPSHPAKDDDDDPNRTASGPDGTAKADEVPARTESNMPGAGDTERRCMVYITEERVMGLIELPLRGDPTACMGLIAHPQRIAGMAVSYDGAFVFTAGGEDQAVMQWAVHPARLRSGDHESDSDSENDDDWGGTNGYRKSDKNALNASCSHDDAGVPLDHLLAVVEGGHLRGKCNGIDRIGSRRRGDDAHGDRSRDWGYEESDVVKDIVDYFYYAQIRAQGEATTAKRELLGAIRFSQMPNLMRALGYYPSELEMGHLAYEVANMYGPRDEELAKINVDSILLNFAQFMRLYVNYRPVRGVTRRDVEAAFRALGAQSNQRHVSSGDRDVVIHPNSSTTRSRSGRQAITEAAVSSEETRKDAAVRADDPVLSRDSLFATLASRGEPLSGDELQAVLGSLLGDEVRVDMLDNRISARAFAAGLLGFEDFDDDEAEEEAKDDVS